MSGLKVRTTFAKRLLISSVVSALVLPTVTAQDVPAPPPGFTWQKAPELKAAFLRPAGWFFKREEEKGTLAYFITKEDIAKNGQFQTGLTVNVFHLKQDSAVARAKDLIDQLATEKKSSEKWARDFGPFKEFGCRFEDTDPSGTIVAQNLTIANPKTNTMYFFVFESPKSEWDGAWKIGKVIMDNLAIDDEI